MAIEIPSQPWALLRIINFISLKEVKKYGVSDVGERYRYRYIDQQNTQVPQMQIEN